MRTSLKSRIKQFDFDSNGRYTRTDSTIGEVAGRATGGGVESCVEVPRAAMEAASDGQRDPAPMLPGAAAALESLHAWVLHAHGISAIHQHSTGMNTVG